jgi:hypothetical protein
LTESGGFREPAAWPVLLTEFDESLRCVLVQSLTVAPDGGVTVRFRYGREVGV